MVKEKNLEKQFEKQMGCMAGFFQIFDRNQIITGKRLHGHKRLLHSKVVDGEDSSEISGSSTPAISRELVKPAVVKDGGEDVTDGGKDLPPLSPPKSAHRLSVFELKEEIRSSWRFTKETPRLSLDSRAIVDSKGSVHPREIRTNDKQTKAVAVVDGGDDRQRRSPSVIARLMGIEQLPECNQESENAKLRRSSSESRVARDLFNSRSFDNAHSDFVVQNFKAAAAAMKQTKSSVPTNAMEVNSFRNSNEHLKPVNRGLATTAQWKSQQHRKSYFDTADVFPEPKQTMSAYADIEKKLNVNGIKEASSDLQSLKHILEALQLKGLLHSNSKTPPEHRNFIHDRNFQNDMKQSPSTTPGRLQLTNSSLPRTSIRRNLNEKLSTVTVSPRRDRPPPPPQSDRNTGRSPTKTLNSPTHSDTNNGRRNSNSIVKTKTLTVETRRHQRNESSSSDSRRTSPVQSPKTRSTTIDQSTVTNKSPRNKRSTTQKHRTEKITTLVTEDESSSISESTLSTSSQPTSEKSKTEDLREGKKLLERCDKLLQSISDMNAGNELQQPSPVSVLDLYKEDSFSSSISPVPKHTIDFQDLSGDLEEDWWSSMLLKPDESLLLEYEEHNQDTDFVYILQILRAYDQFPENSDIFYILEKQQYLKGNENDLFFSKAPVLHRRVVFDIITEIIENNTGLPPWKAFIWTDPLSSKLLLKKIWNEFKRIRGDRKKEGFVVEEEDIFEIVCGALEKDLGGSGSGNGGWEDIPVEVSEVVLDIERLVFKDLINETISELADQHGWRSPAAAAASRRKLVL